MKQIWLLLMLPLLLTGCDLGKEEREAAKAIYKSNADAAKQCEDKLRSLKRVPIVGTDGKLLLDAERLPMWELNRGRFFRSGDECAIRGLENTQIFYWTGEKIISQHDWVFRDSHNSIEVEQNKDWIIISAMVFFGNAPDCKSAPNPRCVMNPPDKHAAGVIPLNNYPIDAWPIQEWPEVRSDVTTKRYRLALRDWPDEAGWARMIGQTCDVVGLKPDQIRNLDFSGKPGSCQIDFIDFRFENFWARINFPAKDLGRITPVLKAFQHYLNESIIEEVQP